MPCTAPGPAAAASSATPRPAGTPPRGPRPANVLNEHEFNLGLEFEIFFSKSKALERTTVFQKNITEIEAHERLSRYVLPKT